ncbi:MAG TPA: hypothetical protein VE032_09415 [Actinomycetota bacterium]|nr:hypothetical protein [Actinomycetota bacterium]
MNRPVVTALLVALAATSLAACTVDVEPAPDCTEPGDATVILLAQAVPTATVVPCVGAVPAGWSFAGGQTRDGEGSLRLLSSQDGAGIIELRLTATCAPGDAPAVPPRPEELGARVFDAPTSLEPLEGVRYVVFEGGCATITYTFPGGIPAAQALEATHAFAYLPRADVVARVEAEMGQILCGAEAPPCEGE